MRPRLIGVFLLTGWLAAVPGVSAQESAADRRTIEAVKAVDKAIWEAATACDKTRWSSLVADDLALISSVGTLMNKAQLGAVCTYEWKMEPLKVMLYGDVAVVIGNHFYRKKGEPPSTPLELHLYTRVYEKRNSRWLWVYGQHQHATKPLPVF